MEREMEELIKNIDSEYSQVMDEKDFPMNDIEVKHLYEKVQMKCQKKDKRNLGQWKKVLLVAAIQYA